MRSLKEWQKLIAESANQKFPANKNKPDLDFIESIKKNLLDVEEAIKKEKGISTSQDHAHQEPNYRLAALLAPIFILGEKRGVEIEKELELVLNGKQ